MLWKHLAAAAGLAVSTTDAFIIVPEISAADNEIVRTLPAHDASAALDAQNMSLDCRGCPVELRSPSGSSAYAMNLPSHLELTFSVDTSGPVDRLLVNDFELYPDAGSWYTSLRALHVPSFDDSEVGRDAQARGYLADPTTRHLGYTLGIRPVAADEAASEVTGDTDSQLRLIEIDLQIIKVGFDFVHGVPAVQVRLMETPTGKLMIGSLEQLVPEPAAPADGKEANKDAGEPECESVFCNWRNSVLKGLKSLRASCAYKHGHGHGHGHPHPHTHAHGQAENHKYMKGHYKHHTWGRLLKNITWSIFLPILIGLVAGVSVAIVGMAFGTLAICLWRLVFRSQTPWMARHRRRRAGHQSSRHRAVRNETAVADEKAGLMENQDEHIAPLPPYEEKAPTQS